MSTVNLSILVKTESIKQAIADLDRLKRAGDAVNNTVNMTAKVSKASAQAVQQVGTATQTAAAQTHSLANTTRVGTTRQREYERALFSTRSQHIWTSQAIGGTARVMGSFSTYTIPALIAVTTNLGLKAVEVYTKIRNQVALLTADYDEQTRVMDRLYDISLRTFSDMDGNVKILTATSGSMAQLGYSTEQTYRFLELYNKSLALTNPTTQEARAVAIQFAQAMGSGVLRGEEFNSIMENGRGIAMQLADALGVNVGQLRSMAHEGMLTADVVVDALMRQGETIDDLYRRRMPSLDQAWGNLGKSIVRQLDVMNNSMGSYNEELGIATTVTQEWAQSIEFASKNMEGMLDLIKPYAIALASVTSVLAVGKIGRGAIGGSRDRLATARSERDRAEGSGNENWVAKAKREEDAASRVASQYDLIGKYAGAATIVVAGLWSIMRRHPFAVVTTAAIALLNELGAIDKMMDKWNKMVSDRQAEIDRYQKVFTDITGKDITIATPEQVKLAKELVTISDTLAKLDKGMRTREKGEAIKELIATRELVREQLKLSAIESERAEIEKQRQAALNQFKIAEQELNMVLEKQHEESSALLLNDVGLAVRKMQQTKEFIKVETARQGLTQRIADIQKKANEEYQEQMALMQSPDMAGWGAAALETKKDELETTRKAKLEEAEQLKIQLARYEKTIEIAIEQSEIAATEARQNKMLRSIQDERSKALRDYIDLQTISMHLTEAERLEKAKDLFDLETRKSPVEEAMEEVDRLNKLRETFAGDEAMLKLVDEKELDTLKEINEQFRLIGESMRVMTDTGNDIADTLGRMNQLSFDRSAEQERLAELSQEQLKIYNDHSKTEKQREQAFKNYSKLEAKQQSDTLRYYGQLAGQMAGAFEQGSKQAELFMVLQQSLAVVEGVRAILSSGSGDPYTAPFRMALMAAQVGILLANIGQTIAGGGSGGSDSLPTVGMANGGVLGGGTSESVQNSMEFLNDINADQYAELREINRGIKDLNSGVKSTSSALYASGDMTRLSTPVVSTFKDKLNFSSDLSGLGAVGNFASNALNWVSGGLFGSTSRSLKDYGINVGGTFQDIGVGGYQTIETKKDGGWFGKSSKKTSDYGMAISGQVETELQKTFTNIYETVVGVGDALGRSVETQAQQYRINIGKISTSGDSATVERKILEAINIQADRLSYSVFSDLVDAYGKVGEAALETAVRLAGEKVVTEDILAMTGMGFGGDTIALSQSLSYFADGIANLQDASSSFFTNFYSEQEQFAYQQEQMRKILATMNLTLPDTIEGYKQLVQAQDLSTRQGQEAYVELMKLSELAADYYDELEAAEEKRLSSIKSLADVIYGQIATINKAAKSAITSLQGAMISQQFSMQYNRAVVAQGMASLQAGQMPDVGKLTGAVSALGRVDNQQFATAYDFAKAQGENLVLLSNLEELTAGYVDIDEQQLNVLVEIRDALTESGAGMTLGDLTSTYGAQLPTSALETLFRQLDRNGDGTLSPLEAMYVDEAMKALVSGSASSSGLLMGTLGIGFANGGYTGHGSKYDVAGVVHAGEYVIPKWMTESLGGDFIGSLETMRKKGYADGGYVGMNSVTTTNPIVVELRQLHREVAALRNENTQLLRGINNNTKDSADYLEEMMIENEVTV